MIWISFFNFVTIVDFIFEYSSFCKTCCNLSTLDSNLDLFSFSVLRFLEMIWILFFNFVTTVVSIFEYFSFLFCIRTCWSLFTSDSNLDLSSFSVLRLLEINRILCFNFDTIFDSMFEFSHFLFWTSCWSLSTSNWNLDLCSISISRLLVRIAFSFSSFTTLDSILDFSTFSLWTNCWSFCISNPVPIISTFIFSWLYNFPALIPMYLSGWNLAALPLCLESSFIRAFFLDKSKSPLFNFNSLKSSSLELLKLLLDKFKSSICRKTGQNIILGLCIMGQPYPDLVL